MKASTLLVLSFCLYTFLMVGVITTSASPLREIVRRAVAEHHIKRAVGMHLLKRAVRIQRPKRAGEKLRIKRAGNPCTKPGPKPDSCTSGSAKSKSGSWNKK